MADLPGNWALVKVRGRPPPLRDTKDTRATVHRVWRETLQLGSAQRPACLPSTRRPRGTKVLRSETETLKQVDLRAGVYYGGS